MQKDQNCIIEMKENFVGLITSGKSIDKYYPSKVAHCNN